MSNYPDNGGAIPTHRDMLAGELHLRERTIAGFSQQRFAKEIGIAPATLSRILAGKKGLSVTAAKKITEKLRLNEVDTRYFIDSVRAEHEKSTILRTLFKTKRTQVQLQGASPIEQAIIPKVLHYFPELNSMQLVKKLIAMQK